jgi:hypothetical protein
MQKVLKIAALVFLFVGVAYQNSLCQEKSSALAQGRTYTEQFYNKAFEDVHSNFSSQMKSGMPLQAFSNFYTQAIGQIGIETIVLKEEVDSTSSPYIIYNRIASFKKYPGPVLVRWVFDAQMTIQGFAITPIPQEAKSNYLEYETKTNLILPFNGEWFVFWGGRKIADNYHAAYPDQRFAYDFLQMKEGKSFSGSPDKNENYYCFAQPVIAPGDGKIIAMENSIPDNVPGEMNPENPLGNYVVIDHGNGEFSFLAHFKQNSITVKTGDSIKQGASLGLCGNSGNSSEPHVHFHLQNSAEFGKGEGLPVQFKQYTAAGNKVASGEPVKGELVENQ